MYKELQIITNDTPLHSVHKVKVPRDRAVHFVITDQHLSTESGLPSNSRDQVQVSYVCSQLLCWFYHERYKFLFDLSKLSQPLRRKMY